MAHNEGQRLVELHHHLVVGAEGPDPLDQHLRVSKDVGSNDSVAETSNVDL